MSMGPAFLFLARAAGIALAIALLPTLAVVCVAEKRRGYYAIAGMLGGVVGGFGGAAALFLGLWLSCWGQTQGCNTAQGDMGLLVSFPAGAFLGSIAALVGVRVVSKDDSRKKRMAMMALLLAAWGAVMLLCTWWLRCPRS